MLIQHTASWQLPRSNYKLLNLLRMERSFRCSLPCSSLQVAPDREQSASVTTQLPVQISILDIRSACWSRACASICAQRTQWIIVKCVLDRGAVEKKTVLENLDLILLSMDETVDGGCVIAAFKLYPPFKSYRNILCDLVVIVYINGRARIELCLHLHLHIHTFTSINV